MVIMSMETYEGLSKRLKMYQSLMTLEKQIKEGNVQNAKESLSALKEKYDI